MIIVKGTSVVNGVIMGRSALYNATAEDKWADQETILMTDSLKVADVAMLKTKQSAGVVLENSALNNSDMHALRSLNIPVIVGVKKILDYVKRGDLLIIDGYRNQVIINPDERSIRGYEQTRQRYEQDLRRYERLRQLPTTTKDGDYVSLLAKVVNPEELQSISFSGAQGIGLCQTDYIYENSLFPPTEETQLNAYRLVIEQAIGDEVIFSTTTFGYEMGLSYFASPKPVGANPLLGQRGVRLSLDEKKLFSSQLRSLFRVAHEGKIKVVFPQVTALEDLHECLFLVRQTKRDLAENGISFAENLSFGVSIDTPASAMLAEVLAKEVDFLQVNVDSILTHMFGADKSAGEGVYQRSLFSPVLLRLLRYVMKSTEKVGVPVSIVFSGVDDDLFVPVLLGLGYRDICLPPAILGQVKELVGTLDNQELAGLVEPLLAKHSATEVLKALELHFKIPTRQLL